MTHFYTPPLVVDIVYLGALNDELRSLLAGLYEMLHRDLGLPRGADGLPVVPPREQDPTDPPSWIRPGSAAPPDGFESSEGGRLLGRPAPYWRNLAARRDVEVPVFLGRDFETMTADRERSTAEDPESHRVIVALLTRGALDLPGKKIDGFLNALDDLGASGAVVLHVPLSREWFSNPRLQQIPLRDHLFPSAIPGAHDRPSLEVIEEAIAVELCRLLGGRAVRVFISHAKADLDPTGRVAGEILSYLQNRTRIKAFFDALDLQPGNDLIEQLGRAQEHGLLLCVEGDDFADSPYCEGEVLAAKRNGLPILTVTCLRRGEACSLAFGGNHRRVPWPM
ncbi:MAG: toll/interleukin-1 receptor domain-containing protein, partial [Planctomycetes bacterium]|nr:toll/interleukin-1 receptor domain-containing protein [Planctomycetota bacterium]